MFRISVCYGQPVDPAAFDEHYNSTHIPLTLKVPGLVRFTTGKPRSLGRTGPPHYRWPTSGSRLPNRSRPHSSPPRCRQPVLMSPTSPPPA